MARIKWAALAMAAVVTLGMGMASTAKAGSPMGTTITHERVEAFDCDEYTVVFEGGEPAAVVLKGDGDTKLDLKVYDENGHLVDADTDDGDGAAVVWMPKQTGKYIIRVVNRGPVYNRYVLGTN